MSSTYSLRASFENGKFRVEWTFPSDDNDLDLQPYDRIEVIEQNGEYDDITCAVQITQSMMYSDKVLIEPVAPLNLADGLYYAVYISSTSDKEIARSGVFTTNDNFTDAAAAAQSSFEEKFLVDNNEGCTITINQTRAINDVPGKENCEIDIEWEFQDDETNNGTGADSDTGVGKLLTTGDYICIVPLSEVENLKNVYYNHPFGLASGKPSGKVSMQLGGYVLKKSDESASGNNDKYQVCYLLNHQIKGSLRKGSSAPFTIENNLLPHLNNNNPRAIEATKVASQQFNMSTVMQYTMQNQMENVKATTSATSYNPLLTIIPKKEKWSKLIEEATNDHKELEDELLVHLDEAKNKENKNGGGEVVADQEDFFIDEEQMTSQITTAIQTRPCFLFAGAGISMAAPSSAPSWWKLMSDVLEETLKAVPDDLQHVAEKLRTIDSYRRPEEVMETYYFILEEKLFDVFKLLNEGKPNTNHRAIAKMAKGGKITTILTTNFDEFIEQALDDEGVHYKVICTNEEFKEYLENACEEFAVLKIHGTVSRPETIIAVASHYKTSGGFEGYKSLVAHHFIRNFPTVFLGYSGWDFAHANYQEFWDAAGRAGGENIYFMRRKGSSGGPLLSKLVGRHVGDRLVIGEGDLPQTAISIWENFDSDGAKELLQLDDETSAISPKSIQKKQRDYIKSWVHQIPTSSLLSIVWNESIYLNEGTNSRLEKTRQRRVKKDPTASTISAAETDSITAYLMDLSTKFAQGIITNEEYMAKQKKATIELSLASLMISKRKKENIINVCAEAFQKDPLLIGSDDYQMLLPSYILSIADVADDGATPTEIINEAIDYVAQILEPLRMKKDDGDERSKILYELYHIHANLLRIPDEERKEIHELFEKFADEAIEKDWSEDEKRDRTLQHITPVVNRIAFHQIDTQAIINSMVSHILKLDKGRKRPIESILKGSHILALSLHKQAVFITSDFYRLDEVQKLLQIFSMDVNKEVQDIYYEKVEKRLNKSIQPVLDLLKTIKKKRKHNFQLSPEECLSTFEIANGEFLRLLLKNSSTLITDELRRESCGYYPRDRLPPSVASYISKKILRASKQIHDKRAQQACLGMLCVLGESSNNVKQMKLSVDKSMGFTEGKVTETTPYPIPEALAAQYQEKGDLGDALHYYKLALEGIRTFVPRQKTDSIVLNACLVQSQFDVKEALKMAFEFSPFFNEVQQYSIVGPARGILVQQCTAWAGELGFSLDESIEKLMNEDTEDVGKDNVTQEDHSEDSVERQAKARKQATVRRLPMGGRIQSISKLETKEAVQGEDTCANCRIC